MKQKILDLLARHACEGSDITEDSLLKEDLGLNSLSMMMMLWESEQTLGKKTDVSMFASVKTVGDLFRALEAEEE